MIQTGKNQEKSKKSRAVHAEKKHDESHEVIKHLGDKNTEHAKFSPGQSPDYNPEDYNTD